MAGDGEEGECGGVLEGVCKCRYPESGPVILLAPMGITECEVETADEAGSDGGEDPFEQVEAREYGHRNDNLKGKWGLEFSGNRYRQGLEE